MGLRNEAFFYFKKQGRRTEKSKPVPPLPKQVGLPGPTRNSKMVMFFAVKLKLEFSVRKYTIRRKLAQAKGLRH
jgi:hypothetical protein